MESGIDWRKIENEIGINVIPDDLISAYAWWRAANREAKQRGMEIEFSKDKTRLVIVKATD